MITAYQARLGALWVFAIHGAIGTATGLVGNLVLRARSFLGFVRFGFVGCSNS